MPQTSVLNPRQCWLLRPQCRHVIGIKRDQIQTRPAGNIWLNFLTHSVTLRYVTRWARKKVKQYNNSKLSCSDPPGRITNTTKRARLPSCPSFGGALASNWQILQTTAAKKIRDRRMAPTQMCEIPKEKMLANKEMSSSVMASNKIIQIKSLHFSFQS